MVKMFLRLYGIENCSHCQTAVQFLIDRGMAFQFIEAMNDPIVHQGIMAVTGTPSFPVLVVFSEGRGEILSGFKQEHYERIANEYIKFGVGADASNPVVNESNHIEQTAQVANQQE